jgi:hypothetical protein
MKTALLDAMDRNEHSQAEAMADAAARRRAVLHLERELVGRFLILCDGARIAAVESYNSFYEALTEKLGCSIGLDHVTVQDSFERGHRWGPA